MSRREVLGDEALARALEALPGWALVGGKLHRELRFSSFTRAFGFMAACATVAERLDHHPEWSNVYGTVKIELVTHDAGGVTELDVALATAMSELAAPFGA
jgi:4a-hydroxytetrahydrobiopterin dehydratase